MMTAKMGEKDSKEEILKAFRLFDDDDTGKITFRNLKRVAKELGENMTDEELQEMIDEADRDGDGEINEDEFLKVRRDLWIVVWAGIFARPHILPHVEPNPHFHSKKSTTPQYRS